MVIDIWAAAAASAGSAMIATRAQMLRPGQQTWIQAPAIVWGGLSFLALGLGMSAITLWFGAHATAREAMVYSLLAATSLAMLLNLNRHGRRAQAERQRIRREVDAVLDASGPAAIYSWEQPG